MDENFRKLSIGAYRDTNTLQAWPLSQLASKCTNLESLKLSWLARSPPASRSEFFNLAVQVASHSTCLHTLAFRATGSPAEDGDNLLQALVDVEDFNTLQTFTIYKESVWFEHDRDGCLAPLLVLVARQANLRCLELT